MHLSPLNNDKTEALLVVDDEESFLHLAKFRLRSAGINTEILLAQSIDTALDQIMNQDSTRIIFFDQDLNDELLGSDLCARVRQELNGSKILLALTSSTDPQDRQLFKEAKADGFIPKYNFEKIALGIEFLAAGRKMPYEYAEFMSPPHGFWTPRIIETERDGDQ